MPTLPRAAAGSAKPIDAAVSATAPKASEAKVFMMILLTVLADPRVLLMKR